MQKFLPVSLVRVVRDERLDHLAPDDPAALRSRRDLARVHVAMGSRGIVARGLRTLLAASPPSLPITSPIRVLELGAGDGGLMLRVARALGGLPGPVQLTLLDRHDIVGDATREHYAGIGWQVETRVVDVLDWAREEAVPDSHDLIVTTLFLHHFEGDALDALLGAMALAAPRAFACEPRRAPLALVGSHLVGLIGANAVTRHDAVLSVHAGFRDAEISARWPGGTETWRLDERAAGPFSHVFSARRGVTA